MILYPHPRQGNWFGYPATCSMSALTRGKAAPPPGLDAELLVAFASAHRQELQFHPLVTERDGNPHTQSQAEE